MPGERKYRILETRRATTLCFKSSGAKVLHFRTPESENIDFWNLETENIEFQKSGEQKY